MALSNVGHVPNAANMGSSDAQGHRPGMIQPLNQCVVMISRWNVDLLPKSDREPCISSNDRF